MLQAVDVAAMATIIRFGDSDLLNELLIKVWLHQLACVVGVASYPYLLYSLSSAEIINFLFDKI